MNLDRLLAPIDDTAPCGENLEYDAEFMALEQACTGKTEQQFGQTIIPAEAPEWRQIEQQALTLLARTKDIRLILIVTEAWTHLHGLKGCAAGLTLLTRTLSQYWEALYPPLEFDGEPDPLLRINALAALSDRSTFSATLRQTLLIKSSTGEISLRDASALADGSKHDVPGYPGGLPRLQEELTQEEQSAAAALLHIEQQLQALRHFITQHLGASAVPEMTSLNKIIIPLLPLLRHQLEEVPDDSTAERADNEPRASTPATTDWQQAQLHSREDALLMLEKVRLYFQQNEPSHPAPMMIERVQRLIQLDFMDIIRELAPDAINQLQGVFGRSGQ